MWFFEDQDAKQRSLSLLQDWLSEEQLKQYEDSGTFLVTGNATGTKYKINREKFFNIRVFDAVTCEETSERYCVVPLGCEAVGDRMLAQKIWLETEEIKTLKKANLSGVPWHQSVLGKLGYKSRD